jgi:hypothetical protein
MKITTVLKNGEIRARVNDLNARTQTQTPAQVFGNESRADLSRFGSEDLKIAPVILDSILVPDYSSGLNCHRMVRVPKG